MNARHETMIQCHIQLEQAQALMTMLKARLSITPDDTELARSCREASQRYLDASLALMQVFDAPPPAVEARHYSFTTGAIARQFRSPSSRSATGRSHRGAASRRQQQRRVRLYAPLVSA